LIFISDSAARIQILAFQTFQGSLGAEGERGDSGFNGFKVCKSLKYFTLKYISLNNLN
jgi:hypothetical protein